MKKISAVNNNFSFKNTKFYFCIKTAPRLMGAVLGFSVCRGQSQNRPLITGLFL